MGNVFAKDKLPSNVSGGANPPTPVLPKVTPPGPPPSPVASLNRQNSMPRQNSSRQNSMPRQNSSRQNSMPRQNTPVPPSPTVTQVPPQGGAGRRRKSRKSKTRKCRRSRK